MKAFFLQKEFATKWVEALRENRVPKTIGVFKSKNKNGEDCYCGNGLGYYANGFTFDDKNSSIVEFNGEKIYLWNSSYKLPVPPDLIEAVVKLNDDMDKTFPEIADWIEANVTFI